MRKGYKIIYFLFSLGFIVIYFFKIPSMFISNKIDNIYIINLKDQSKDRLSLIKDKMDRAGLKFNVFDAVYGNDVNIVDEYGVKFTGRDLATGKYQMRLGESYKIFCPNITINYKYSAPHIDNPMKSGTIGCYCSHLEVMLKIAKSKDKFSIILEDDADIEQDLPNKLNKLIKSLSPKWDLIILGMVKDQPSIARKLKSFRPVLFSNQISSINSTMPGAHAYAINHLSAGKILGYLIDTDRQIDYRVYQITKDKNINVFFANKTKINQNVGMADSEIARINTLLK
jgi:glycosyl transferase family 25